MTGVSPTTRGPRTEPWGSPNGAGTHRDLVEPWATMKERSCRNEVSQPRIFPERPKEIDRRVDSLEPSWSYSCQSGLQGCGWFQLVGLQHHQVRRYCSQVDGNAGGWCTIETQIWMD